MNLSGACRWCCRDGHRRRGGADGAASVAFGIGVDVVGALLDEMTVASDCGCCRGRHSTPTTPSSSNTATETPIIHRDTGPAEPLCAVALSVLDGKRVTWGLRAAEAGVSGGGSATHIVVGLSASAHRDSHCQAVHRTCARSSGDMAQAGAANQRDIADTVVTQRVWEQPAPPPDPAQALAVWGHGANVLATCEVPDGYFPTDQTERSRP